ncbi:MAG: LLM class flavin-dependent oxidoreductase [Chloroflexota bacterium]|nr:LLM class flavin-dependent oxidoreductase [Chloroflexota bacterium]
MTLRIGILIMPRPPLASIIERCRQYEALGFDSVWLCDHFVDQALGPLFESWTLLAAIAASTSRSRLGIAATCVPFRHPALLAKAATTVDHISGGRLELGLGAGWWQPEFERFGYDFPPPDDRTTRFIEAVTALRLLFTEQEVTLRGSSLALTNATMLPKPVQRPHPPLVLAAQGPRMLDTVARHGDAWLASFGLTWQEIRERNDRLDERCLAYGRAPARVRRIFLWAPWVQEIDPWSSAAAFADFISAYRAAGITEVILDEPRHDQRDQFATIVLTTLPSLAQRSPEAG